MRQSLESSSRLFGAGKMALAFALLLGASQFAASIPAGAGAFKGGDRGNGGEHDDWAADHSDVYQVIRGDLVCHSREACGGAAAIPMNRPGWFFLPGGAQRAQYPAPPPVAYHPVPAHLKHHKRY
ncbi:hypothetical protein SAMN05519103_03962 [Rhizobiales bacterium GAS113]|nr:hypothetical protein SAMN05519103_03962 [Rhizobiales bacterium GAS113]